jgi:hypothetical protein
MCAMPLIDQLNDDDYFLKAAPMRGEVNWDLVVARASNHNFGTIQAREELATCLSMHGFSPNQSIDNSDQSAKLREELSKLPIIQDAFNAVLSEQEYSIKGIKFFWTRNQELNHGDASFIATRSSRSQASTMDIAAEVGAFAVLHPYDSASQVQDKIAHAFAHSGNQFGVVCGDQVHWTLLAVDKERQCYRYLDSYGNPLESDLKASLQHCPELQVYSELPYNTHLQQYDMNSCGVWVLHNASMVRQHGIDYDCAKTGSRIAADALIAKLRRDNEYILDDAIRGGGSLSTRTYSECSSTARDSLEAKPDVAEPLTLEIMRRNLEKQQPSSVYGSPTSPRATPPGRPRPNNGCCTIL